ESVCRWNPKMPLHLQQIISRCLQKDREQRYISAHALLIDLREARQKLVHLPTTSAPQAAERSLFASLLAFFGMNNLDRFWELTQFRLGMLQVPFLVYFGWKFWDWTPTRSGLGLFLAELACVTVLATQRGRLLAVSVFRREDLSREILDAVPVLRWATIGLALVLGTMALMLADTHAGMAAVLGVLGVMDLV